MLRSLRILGVMALSLASGGCSFLFADAPPDRHETMLYFDCTSTPGLEVADGVFGLGSTLTAIGALSQSEREFEEENDGGNRDTFAATNFVVAGVFVGSAIYGIVVTENCKDAKEELRHRIIERERQRAARPPAPAPLAPPPPTPPVPTAPVTPSEAGNPTAPPAPPPTSSPPVEPAAPAPAQGAPPTAAPPPPPAPKPGTGSF